MRIYVAILMLGLLLMVGCTRQNNTNFENPFFFKSDVSELCYTGYFLFDDIIEEEITLHINKIAELKYGKLYELMFDSTQVVLSDRSCLGYFYVQKDKIIKIDPIEENFEKLKRSEDLPEGSEIVWQDKELRDTLGENEKGWYHYLNINGNKCESHSYNNLIETGYYESFIWEEGIGLIQYRSGFGAERELIELRLN